MLNSKLNQIQIMNNSENEEEEEENDLKIQEKNSIKLSEINVQKNPDNIKLKNNILLDSYTCLIKRRKKSIQFSDNDDDYRRQFRENDHFNKPQGILKNFILSL